MSNSERRKTMVETPSTVSKSRRTQRRLIEARAPLAPAGLPARGPTVTRSFSVTLARMW